LRPEHVRGMRQAAKVKLFEIHRQTFPARLAAQEPR
jgi:hypothetical protein